MSTQTTSMSQVVQKNVQTDSIASSVASARAVGLRYVTDTHPGIIRKRAGKHFSYVGLDGKPIHDEEVIQRIRSLGIPPAWKNVWICPNPRGHIQATGRDAKGHKQYRYHPLWRKIRDEHKYDRMITFGKALPTIRERVSHDLALSGLPREKVLATIVQKKSLFSPF
jgi:DNA topoisomerase-1